jgi:hypothetical protein
MARATPFSTTDWQAGDVPELRRIWKDLRPESAEEGTERRFHDRVLTAEQAGDVFERWVLEAFRLSGATGHYAFRVPMRGSGDTREELDGLIFDGWQGFLLECKFWTGKVDFGPIALLHTLIDARPAGTLGLFFSAFNYTLPALEAAEMLRPLRVLLFDRADLEWALGPKSIKGRMVEMVRQRWMLTVKYGRPHGRLPGDLDLFGAR